MANIGKFLGGLFGRRRGSSPVETRRDSGRAKVTAPGPQEHGAGRVHPCGPVGNGAAAPVAPPPAGGVAGSPPTVGQRVAGIYEVRGVLGRGGMGIVYLGHGHATQRKVAIKAALGAFVDDPDARKRFMREAEAWTAMVHPHIVHAFDVRDDQSTNYRPVIVMDYCTGGSLTSRIAGGKRLVMADALDTAIQVCWAMEFAHAKGHLHRDLNPNNVLLDGDGGALVTDFGLVKSLGAEDHSLPPGMLSGEQAELLATVSTCGGTPEYMPPEQWEGRAEKPADIYAFGIMLYELVCGRRPFAAGDRLALRIPHATQPPPDPRQFNDGISEGLAELMLACLAKRPKERPGDFGQVTEGLSDAYRQLTGQDSTSRRGKPSGAEISRSDQEARVWAMIRLGNGCRLRGDLDDAMRMYRQVEATCRKLGCVNGLATCIGNQAMILQNWGQLEAAMALHKEEERLCRELGDKDGLATCLGNQALILQDWGKLDAAMELLKQQEQICREFGNENGLSHTLGNQAVVMYHTGDLDGAMRLLQEQERICHKLGKKHGLSISLNNQALILRAWGKLDAAVELGKEEERLCRELGDKDGLKASLGNQADTLYARGDLNAAMDLYKELERICRELGSEDGLVRSLANHAYLLAYNLGRPREALPLAEEAYRLAAASGLTALTQQIQLILEGVRSKIQ